LNEIDEKVQSKIDKSKKYQVKNYDFNDDNKEVLIDLDQIAGKMKSKDDKDSDQSGFEDLDEADNE
jgi:hypothetical protein